MSTCTLPWSRSNRPAPDYSSSPQSVGEHFRNPAARPPSEGISLKDFFTFFFNKPKNTEPPAAPEVMPLTRADLDAAPDRSLFRLGHSTLLLKLRGGFWITDPVFAKRASPVQWAGPKRFHAPPISLSELPPLRGVVLSHDHYDHLDRKTVLKLARKTDVFLTPLGVGDRLVK